MLIYSIIFVKPIALIYLCVNMFTCKAKAKYPAQPPRKGHIALRNGENVTSRVSVGDRSKDQKRMAICSTEILLRSGQSFLWSGEKK